MTDNRSLDEFAGPSGGGDDGPSEADGTDGDDGPSDVDGTGVDDGAEPADAEPEREAAVEPVASTYAWSPEGGACAACGETAEERWRDGDDLVCLDCKEW